MSYTEQALEAQRVQLQDLRAEKSRLDALFGAQMNALGLRVEDLAAAAPVAPELTTKLVEAQEKARREGAARAAQCHARADSAAKPAGTLRKGAIRM